MKLKIIFLFIFVSCVPIQSIAQDKSVLSDSGNYCLWYDNLFSCDSILLSFFYEYRRQELYIPSIPTSYENVMHIKQKIRVPEFVFRHILSYNSVVQTFSESTKRTKIEKIINEKACYYCGKVKICKQFDSYLFYLQHLNSEQNVADGEIMIDDKLILVNIYNNTITSISCMLSYFCWDDCMIYSWIDLHRDNDYLFYSASGEGDIVFPNDSNTYNDKAKIRFKFNDMGQIIVLPLNY